MMRVVTVAALLILATGSGYGAAQIQKGSISGIVVVDATEEPLSGVRVSLPGVEGLESVTTDSHGRFSFMDVPEGTQVAILNRDGYLQSRERQLVTVVAGEAREARLVMARSGVIAGKATNGQGRPIVGLELRLGRLEYREDTTGLQSVPTRRTIITDDTGSYRAFGLQPGDYYVGITTSPVRAARQTAAGRGGPDAFQDFLFYPNVSDWHLSQPVHLGSGDEVLGVDFVGVERKTPRIEVVGFVGVPSHYVGAQAPSEVYIVPSNGAAWIGEPISIPVDYGIVPDRSSLSRRFSIKDLSPGQYDLFLVARAPSAGYLAKKLRLDLRAAPGPVYLNDFKDILVEKGVDLSIDPTYPANSKEELRNRIRIRLSSTSSLPSILIGTDLKAPEPDGRFVYSNLPVGMYRFEIIGLPADAYVDELKISGKPDVSNVVDVNGPEPSQVGFRVALSGAVLTGSVLYTDGPATATSVYLIPDGGSANNWLLHKQVTAAADGTFLIRGVAPGNYRLVATSSIAAGSEKDPAVIRRIVAESTKLTVLENSAISGIAVRFQ